MSCTRSCQTLGRELTLTCSDDFEHSSYEPPPLKALNEHVDYATRQANDFAELLGPLAAARRSLRHLRVRDVDNETREAFHRTPKTGPPMCIAFDRISQEFCTRILPSLALLRTMHLRLYARSKDLYRHVSRHGRLRQILTNLPSLQNLQLCFDSSLESIPIDQDQFPHPIVPLQNIFGDVVLDKLRHLVLAAFWLETDELCDFLLRHRDSLEDLELKFIRLGETMDAERTAMGVGLAGIPCKSYPTTMVVSERWDQIAKTCQQMPKLTGLTITGAAEGIEVKKLGMAGNFRVTDLGMNGRSNSHLQAQAEDRAWGAEWLAEHAQSES